MQGLIHGCLRALLSTSSRYCGRATSRGNDISRHQNLGRWSKLEAKGRPATSCSTHMFLHGGRVFLVPPSLSSAEAAAQSPMDDGCSKRVMGVAVPRDPVEIWSAPTKVPPERDTNSHGPWATLVQQQQLGSPTWALQIVSSCSPVAWNICKVQHEQCRLTCLCSIILWDRRLVPGNSKGKNIHPSMW